MGWLARLIGKSVEGRNRRGRPGWGRRHRDRRRASAAAASATATAAGGVAPRGGRRAFAAIAASTRAHIPPIIMDKRRGPVRAQQRVKAVGIEAVRVDEHRIMEHLGELRQQ